MIRPYRAPRRGRRGTVGQVAFARRDDLGPHEVRLYYRLGPQSVRARSRCVTEVLLLCHVGPSPFGRAALDFLRRRAHALGSAHMFAPPSPTMRPAHVSATTRRRRKAASSRRTPSCPQGHALTACSLAPDRTGQRGFPHAFAHPASDHRLPPLRAGAYGVRRLDAAFGQLSPFPGLRRLVGKGQPEGGRRRSTAVHTVCFVRARSPAEAWPPCPSASLP